MRLQPTSTIQQKIENKYQNSVFKMSLNAMKNRIIYILKNQNKQTINLVLANNNQSKEGKIIEEVSDSPNFKVFDIQEKIIINPNHIVIKLQIKSTEENNKAYIPHHQYRAILHLIEELKKKEENMEDDSDHQMDVQSDGQSESDQNNGHKQQIKQYNDESSNNNNQEHRGRGRPKGSKNKKTIMKEAQQLKQPPLVELKTAMNGLMKRGKGRPKGSKNKAKDYNHSSKNEQGAEPLPFGKRGKGRPKGSKNKIKLSNHVMMDEEMENQEHKRRGRPPGAKNRANSVESVSGQNQVSQQFIKMELERPDPDLYDKYYCCSRCQQIRLKRKIFQSETNVEENIDILKNVYEDLGLQNKSNLIITAIKIGDWQSLAQLLSIVDRIEYYYRSPWNVDKMIDRQRFQTKTKKQFLSKTGKEGNTVLLHDNYKKKEIWWKDITVERIIQNLPRDQYDAHRILEILLANDQDLKNQIYINLASIIRSGNYVISEIILKQVLSSPNNKLNFSQEHYNLLIGSENLINQLKKFNLIQHNDGSNYCSPVHAAAICPNSDFLKKLLQIFTDIINVEDSLHRKPIHYAALSNNIDSLSILVENGADLRDFDRKKMTPLMLACYEGLIYNVQFIIEKVRDPSYINFKSQQGYTALHYAILRNNKECIQLLINDPHVDLWALTKDKGDIFHLLAGTGNVQIMDLILKKQILPYTSHDKFKKSPPMIAIRNNNNDCLVKLIENGCKIEKVDSSLNTLLHYAAAYGNIQAIHILKNRQEQTKNKRGLYPWQLAVFKGHLGAAKLLQEEGQLQFHQDPLYFALTNIRGTQQYLETIKYITNKMMNDIYYQQGNSGSGYLHMICQISQEEYIKIRKEQTYLTVEEIKQEFNWIQNELINFFVERGLDGYKENYNNETPLKLCIENNNLIGVQKLLTGKITFENQPFSGNSILHCLSNLACKGFDEMKFVEKKLKECNMNELKTNLKKIDHNGFDFLLYFVKCFTEKIIFNFKKSVKKQIVFLQHKKESKHRPISIEHQAEKKCFQQFLRYEQKFMNIIDFLLDLGCDINAQVHDRKNQASQQYRKWGIQHFLMRFPSLKLIKFFKSRIRDFNSQNNQLMTPLHLFTKNNKKGNILNANIQLSEEYQSQKILEYLLSIGLNPNCEDCYKALPLLYASLNSQYEFIIILINFKSKVNFLTIKNQIPFIQIIKRSRNFTIQQIKHLLALKMSPNEVDMDKRNSLHHLVFHSTNMDSNPQVCRLLIEQGTNINALDKYERSPIFYCFSDMEGVVHSGEPLEKVQILQVFINQKEINLNLVDVFKRTILHYACEKNHFFSILYLLDKNINIEARDYQQNTPLAISLKNRNLDQAALIISKGVKYGFVEEDGERYSYFSYGFKKLSAGICFLLLDNGYPIQKALEQIPNSCFKQSLIQKYILR